MNGISLQEFSEFTVIDTHVDTILRWVDLGHDLTSGGRGQGYMDLDAAQKGNLGCAFFACCVEPQHVLRGTARKRLTQQLQGITEFVAANHERSGIASSVHEIETLKLQRRFAVVPCIEGAQAIGADLAALQGFANQGVTYISPAHFSSNEWSDSSTDSAIHSGLSGLGYEAVAEMNRLQIAVDVSHVSDDAFWDILKSSRQPAFASHSSCRSLVDHPRNLTDEMMVALGRQGGVVGVTWWPEYISNRFRQHLEARAKQITRTANPPSSPQPEKLTSGIATLLADLGEDDEAKYEVLVSAALSFPSINEILDHVVHVADLIGPDRVCFGSDHGAVNFQIVGLENCSRLLSLANGLAKRGFAPSEIRGMMGDNVLNYLRSIGR